MPVGSTARAKSSARDLVDSDAVHGLARLGPAARSVVWLVTGLFLVRAAVRFDPREAQGLDAALHTVAAQPHGRVLLALAVVGVLAYALRSTVEALYKRLGRTSTAGRSGSSARTRTSATSPGRTSRS